MHFFFSISYCWLAYKNFKNKHFKATLLCLLIVFSIFLYQSTGHNWKKIKGQLRQALQSSVLLEIIPNLNEYHIPLLLVLQSDHSSQIIWRQHTVCTEFIKRSLSKHSSQSLLISCKSTPLEQWVWKYATALLLGIPVQYVLRDLDLDRRQGTRNLSLSDESANYYGKQG